MENVELLANLAIVISEMRGHIAAQDRTIEELQEDCEEKKFQLDKAHERNQELIGHLEKYEEKDKVLLEDIGTYQPPQPYVENDGLLIMLLNDDEDAETLAVLPPPPDENN